VASPSASTRLSTNSSPTGDDRLVAPAIGIDCLALQFPVGLLIDVAQRDPAVAAPHLMHHVEMFGESGRGAYRTGIGIDRSCQRNSTTKCGRCGAWRLLHHAIGMSA